jgi:CBS domain-containing protein
MFSVYGKAGRVFRGSMEDLRHVGPVSAVARAIAPAPIGQALHDQEPVQVPEPPQQPHHGADMAHRSALASYTETAKPHMPRHPLTRVDAIMSSPVVTVAQSMTVEQAWGVLSERHTGQAPVVGDDGTLVGLLSRADLMRPERLPGPQSHALVWRALLLQSVADIMWTPVPSVAPDTDIRRVARVLLDTGLPGLPVADDVGRVIGFVSRSDILRAVVADPPLDLWT